MGHAKSKLDQGCIHRANCFRFPSRLSKHSSPPCVWSRDNAVTTPGLAPQGVRLSWLVSQLNGESDSTVKEMMENYIATLSPMGSAGELECGPATHVVIVHPSMPWIAFMKAMLIYMGVDPRKDLLAGDAPTSPRSPLTPSITEKAGISGAKRTESEAWFFERTFACGAGGGELLHSFYVHIDFLATHASSLIAASATPIPTSPSGKPAAAAASGQLSLASGDSAQRVLSYTTGDPPALLLVIDSAAAIFTDPRAVRAAADAISYLRTIKARERPLHSAPQPKQCHGVPALAVIGPSQPSWLQLVSSLNGADWAPVVAAFGRVTAVLPDDSTAALGVCEAVLESARLQFNAHWPLLHFITTRGSFSVDAELPCPAVGAPSVPAGDGGGTSWAREQHLLPGQIATAERLAIFGGKEDEQGDGEKPWTLGGPTGSGLQGREQGPDSQSGVVRFARHLSADSAMPASPPAVPRADADALGLSRRLTLTESSISVYAAAGRPSVIQPVCDAGSPSSGAASPLSLSPPPVGVTGTDGRASASYSIRGSSSQSAASTCAAVGKAASCARSCLSDPYFGTPGPSAPVSVVDPPAAIATTSAVAVAPVPQLGHALAHAYMSAMASASSSVCGYPECASPLVALAVEAARRYAALLEAIGQWAAASCVLEACVCPVGQHWGHRSARMAALLTQLGRLQHKQGLYRTAEVTWRQALEAWESSHGPNGVPVMLCRVALAQVLRVLQDPEVETMLRATLTALDAALGPNAPDTLVAREALAGYLVHSGRWAEAEVAYQALLQAMEKPPEQPEVEAPPPLTRALSSRQQHSVRRVPSRLLSQQHLKVRAEKLRTAEAQSGGATITALSGDVDARRSESRLRMAWGPYTDEVLAQAVNTNGAMGATALDSPGPSAVGASYTPGFDGGDSQISGAYGTGPLFHRAILPPLSSAGTSSPSSPATLPAAVLPLFQPGGAFDSGVSAPAADLESRARIGRGISGGGALTFLGPGNANVMAWSGAAAALADVIAVIQREFGGFNELYSGMHLAGPAGSTAADLAALAAVCPCSGACIAAVVNVRRLTDVDALYDAAFAVRSAELDRSHPAMLHLQMQYARHLSAAGEHGRAQAICQAALEHVMLTWPQYSSQYHPGGGVGRSGEAGSNISSSRAPDEVFIRQTLGAVLLAGGSLAAATAALSAAVDLAERLVMAGEMAPADVRRIEALDSLSCVLWKRSQPAQAANEDSQCRSVTIASSPLPPKVAASLLYAARAIECKRQELELTAVVCGERHERVMAGLVTLGQMLEAVGDLEAAERAYEGAAEVALHRYKRLSAVSKAIFRQLQRVYEAQGRTVDAQVLGHMYRLNGGPKGIAATAGRAISAGG